MTREDLVMVQTHLLDAYEHVRRNAQARKPLSSALLLVVEALYKLDHEREVEP